MSNQNIMGDIFEPEADLRIGRLECECATLRAQVKRLVNQLDECADELDKLDAHCDNHTRCVRANARHLAKVAQS